MKKISKKIIYIILSVLLLQNVFYPIVYAAWSDSSDSSCVVCGMHSIEFQVYVNFQVEMLQLLRNAVKEKEENIENKRFGLFSAGVLEMPFLQRIWQAWKSMFKKEAEELQYAAKSAAMSAILAWSIVGELVTKDSFGWFKILFKNKPFVRDRKTLQDIDNSIHDAMWDIGTKWLRNKKISNDIYKQLWDLEQKYNRDNNNEYALFSQFVYSADSKYKDVIQSMLSLNALMKTFVSKNNDKLSKDVSNGNMKFRFNYDLMQLMRDNYECARWFSKCNEMFSEFANNTKVWSQLKNWFSESWDIIEEANKNLADAMQSFGSSVKDTFSKKVQDETWLTKKQQDLLRTVYGIDSTKLSREQWIGLESLFHKENWKTVVKDMDLDPLDYFGAQEKEARKEKRELREQEKQDEKYLAELSQENKDKIEKEISEKNLKIDNDKKYQDLDIYMRNTMDSVLAELDQDKSVFMIYSNVSVLRHFREIGEYIHDILENSIGRKDSKWLVKYLWDACEYQCSNNGSTNCYAP